MMKALKFFLLLLGMVFITQAFAEPVRRLYQDVKLPSQVILEKQTFTTPSTASATYLISGNAGITTTTATSFTTFLAQPDMARNITITPGGSTARVGQCTITVTGTDYFDAALTEDFSVSTAASSAVTGSKAFKTVSSVALPAACETTNYSATWSVGIGSKLGYKRCLAYAGEHLSSEFGGAYSSTRAAVAVNTSSIASNTITPAETLDGATDFTAFFLQSFGCFP